MYSTPYNTSNYNSLYDTTVPTVSTSTFTGTSVWAIVSIVLAIVGGILVYCLFIKNNSEPKGKFTKWLKDFLNFKIMWIEPILKVLYYISTIFVILFSFSFIGTNLLTFLLVLIGGPAVLRLSYEIILMFINIWRNTSEIAQNTKKK